MRMHYTLKQLQYFVAAGEAQSVTKAAQSVSVSQPSISAAIAHLETEFGLQLFVRHHAQGLSLTPNGRQLMGEANRLLNQAEELGQFASDLGEAIAGELIVGCFFSIAPILMPNLIQGFCGDNAGLTINCVEGHQETLLAGLHNGGFEIALTYDLQLGDGIEFTPLAALPPRVIVAPDHPLARLNALSPHDLADYPMILLDWPLSREYFISLFLAVGAEPRIAFRSRSLDMVRGMVANGLGYSLINADTRNRQALDGKPFVALPLAGEPRALNIGIARLANARSTKLSEAFAAHCGRALKPPIM